MNRMIHKDHVSSLFPVFLSVLAYVRVIPFPLFSSLVGKRGLHSCFPGNHALLPSSSCFSLPHAAKRGQGPVLVSDMTSRSLTPFLLPSLFFMSNHWGNRKCSLPIHLPVTSCSSCAYSIRKLQSYLSACDLVCDQEMTRGR